MWEKQLNAAPSLYYVETRSDREHSITRGIFVNILPTPSWEAESTSIKTTISWKQWWLGPGDEKWRSTSSFPQTPLCFWGLKRQETHILASFCLFAPLSGEILSERPRMTITNALAEAKQYNVFWVFISLVNSHKSSYKPKWNGQTAGNTVILS